MEKAKFLPDNNENKLYTPREVKECIINADGTAEKKLTELGYAAALAVAIYKVTGDKYLLYPSENPDVHFIEQESVNKRQIGFSVEIMTLFFHGSTFNQDYKELAKLVWEKKGQVDYDRTELLLISRLNCLFDIDAFISSMKSHTWKFSRIWFGSCRFDGQWDFFEIIPPNNEIAIKISSDIECIY